MNKIDALIITGRLEVRLQESESLIKEVTRMQKCIMNDDAFNVAIVYGRMSEMLRDTTFDVTEYMETLYQFVLNFGDSIQNEKIQKERELEEKYSITLDKLDFSVITFNCLKQAGINNIGDIVRTIKSDGYVDRKAILSPNSIDEIKRKLKEYGVELKS